MILNKHRFIKLVNEKRKASKDAWYFILEEVEGKEVKIKGFKTWLQIMEVDGVRLSTAPDITVKKFNETIEKALTYSIQRLDNENYDDNSFSIKEIN
jgi:hypothetical protein